MPRQGHCDAGKVPRAVGSERQLDPLPPAQQWHLRIGNDWHHAAIGDSGSVEGTLLESLPDGTVRLQCKSGGPPVAVLHALGPRAPCSPLVYVHRCSK
eukprot:5575846-Prorocentrum_lima.AAC.1